MSCLDYCNGLYFGIAERLLNQLQLMQNAALASDQEMYERDQDLAHTLIAYKSVNRLAPEYLQNIFQYSHHGHSLKLIVPQYTSSFGRRSLSYT